MRLWKLTIWGLAFVGLVLLWVLVIGVSGGLPGSAFNKGHNAVWVGHRWVAEDMSSRDVYRYALSFLRQARAFDRDINYQAWLGQIRSKIDLSDEEVRKNIGKEVLILTQFVGFDGIHYDIEPVWDGDEDFIELLAETRDVLGEDYEMSVALAEYIPGVFLWFFEDVFELKNYNTEVNYQNVAQYADQIAVMVYDTSIKQPWLYRWLVSEQTIRLSRLLEGTELFVGIPAYDYYDDEFIQAEVAREWFDPEVENVENGLRGIVKGLNNLRSKGENFARVAIYPYWQIEDEEPGLYEKWWME